MRLFFIELTTIDEALQSHLAGNLVRCSSRVLYPSNMGFENSNTKYPGEDENKH
jgi:hypothetical protein